MRPCDLGGATGERGSKMARWRSLAVWQYCGGAVWRYGSLDSGGAERQRLKMTIQEPSERVCDGSIP